MLTGMLMEQRCDPHSSQRLLVACVWPLLRACHAIRCRNGVLTQTHDICVVQVLKLYALELMYERWLKYKLIAIESCPVLRIKHQCDACRKGSQTSVPAVRLRNDEKMELQFTKQQLNYENALDRVSTTASRSVSVT